MRTTLSDTLASSRYGRPRLRPTPRHATYNRRRLLIVRVMRCVRLLCGAQQPHNVRVLNDSTHTISLCCCCAHVSSCQHSLKNRMHARPESRVDICIRYTRASMKICTCSPSDTLGVVLICRTVCKLIYHYLCIIGYVSLLVLYYI